MKPYLDLHQITHTYKYQSPVHAWFLPTLSLSLSLSGPAVHYNAEFNKRIPVTGLGSSIDTYNAELTSKMW